VRLDEPRLRDDAGDRLHGGIEALQVADLQHAPAAAAARIRSRASSTLAVTGFSTST